MTLPTPVLLRARRDSVLILVSAMLVLAPWRAQAQPTPLESGLWAFPGAASAPASAISAGRALSDRWLGEQPFDNPAAAPARGVSASGVIGRISRQDLRSDNRRFSEQAAFVDFGGAWATLPLGTLALSLYAYQPLLRLEDNAFLTGEVGGPVQPATIQSNGSTREVRAGLAASIAWGSLRGGIAGEWTRRSDVYEVKDQSGSPDQGVRHIDFAGDGVGGQAGLVWGADRLESHAWTAGVAARWVPALPVDGVQQFDLMSGDSVGIVSAERESGVEMGASASYRIQPAFRVLAGIGMRPRREWSGFGVTSGQGTQWSVGGEFHDARDPWTLRFGIGQETERGVAEERSGLFGLGLGWKLDHSTIDVGILHRNMSRSDHPTSFDDRLVVSATAEF